MKVSRYNIFRKVDNVNIAFNSLTCALAVVNDDFISIVNAIENGIFDIENCDKDLLNSMKAGGYIIDDDIDEIRKIEFYHNCQKYRTDYLSLTIAPTLQCNFQCVYCYESPSIGIMDENIQDALLVFIKEKIMNINNLNIIWYGGEPMIARDVVYSLSEKIISLCKENDVQYSASIVSNGSLIQDDDIQMFKRYQIESVQLTLDGPRDTHNVRRAEKKGKNTYDIIFDNINKLCTSDIRTTVRINIDLENIDKVSSLLRELLVGITKQKMMKIVFGQVTSLTNACKSIEGKCINNSEFSKYQLQMFEKALSYGFSINQLEIYPRPKLNYCGAGLVNSCVIAPNGDIYKCWEEIGISSKASGNVTNARSITKRFINWIQISPLHINSCRVCKFLPICMGGCPLKSIDNISQEHCDSIRYGINNMIDLYYKYMTKSC